MKCFLQLGKLVFIHTYSFNKIFVLCGVYLYLYYLKRAFNLCTIALQTETAILLKWKVKSLPTFFVKLNFAGKTYCTKKDYHVHLVLAPLYIMNILNGN